MLEFYIRVIVTFGNKKYSMYLFQSPFTFEELDYFLIFMYR